PGGFPGGPGGFPGAPGGPPQPGQIIPGFLQEPLKLTPKQKTLIEELQKEVDAKLEKILTAEQKKMLKGMGMGPGGPGSPFGPPGGFGFGPGNFLAPAILQRADSKKAGKVSVEQLISAAETLFKEADKNKDGKLDEAELGAAIGKLFPAPPGGFGPPGFGPKDPPKPGPKVKPEDVKTFPNARLYEPTVLRTLFLEFENKDWEAELADFYRTDVLVPATLIVDGKKYPNVGVRFRGNSSYFKAPAGYKRSLHLALDFVDKKQRLHGYKTLTLLNGADDPSLMHTVLFSHVARQYMPAAKANFVKLVINGESWGIFPNLQQVNKDFLKENYKTAKGARWKVPGDPGADGGLRYIGDNIADYKRHYQIKSKDNDKDWKALIALCETLCTTPPDKLEAALTPILDIDSVLWFLAIDNAVINDDGYWVRASDYNIYRDPKGKFHLTAHDTNETFQPMGFGFPGGFGKGPKGPGFGPGGGGYSLDPLIGMNDERKPLRSRLLTVPSLRARYLEHIRTIADNSFDWKKLGPVVAQHRALIEKEVEIDTHKLYSLAEFQAAHATEPAAGRGAHFNLRAFADQRRAFLLNHSDIKKAGVE
ncbi:MAG TPA: CotH kinase family protein, partial [Gemmataceae bacterium]|nr:CotH kinase family protein [Gemmataceae bacterium]